MSFQRKFDEAARKAERSERYARMPAGETLPEDWEETTERIVERELEEMRKQMPSGSIEAKVPIFGDFKAQGIPPWAIVSVVAILGAVAVGVAFVTGWLQ